MIPILFAVVAIMRDIKSSARFIRPLCAGRLVILVMVLPGLGLAPNRLELNLENQLVYKLSYLLLKVVGLIIFRSI